MNIKQPIDTISAQLRQRAQQIKKIRREPEKTVWYLQQEFIKPITYPHSLSVQWRYPSQLSRIRALQQDVNQSWLLIILDACRYDRFEKLFDEYFIGDVEPISAAGLDTFEYVQKVWPNEYNLPYITAAAPITTTNFNFSGENPKAQGISFKGKELKRKYSGYIPRNHLNRIIEVWRTHWDKELGVCPPEPVTEQAIKLYKKEQPSQMVVHYFQPHAPYIGVNKKVDGRDEIDPLLKGGAISKEIWEEAKRGELSDKELMDLYDANIKRVLDSVIRLVDEVDETKFDQIIITGDHGEALGEYYQYDHGFEHPYIRKVPWAKITNIKSNMVDYNCYEDQKTIEDSDKDQNVVDRLQELGYLD